MGRRATGQRIDRGIDQGIKQGINRSGPDSPDSARALSKPAQILQAARQVFMDQGYGAASMDAIARAAGVSKATLYAHFGSKEELFAEMISAECRKQSRLTPGTEGEPLRSMADLRTGLLLFARGFIDLVLSPGGLAIHRVVIAETTRFPELGRLFFRSGPDLVQERLGALLREATEAGLLEIPDIRLAGEQFVAMVQQPLHLRRLLDIPDRTAPEAVERILESAVTAFLRAYGRAVQA